MGRREEAATYGNQRGDGGGFNNLYEGAEDAGIVDDLSDTSPNVSTARAVLAAPIVSRSSSRAGSRVVADAASTGGTRSVEGARAAELMDLQRELSEARLQVVGAKKENLALAKALQDSRQRQTDAESTVSELSGHQAHIDQVPDLLSEISQLKSLLAQQEGTAMELMASLVPSFLIV